MTTYLKGVNKSTMSNVYALYKCNKENPSCTQKQLQQWILENFSLQVSEGTDGEQVMYLILISY